MSPTSLVLRNTRGTPTKSPSPYCRLSLRTFGASSVSARRSSTPVATKHGHSVVRAGAVFRRFRSINPYLPVSSAVIRLHILKETVDAVLEKSGINRSKGNGTKFITFTCRAKPDGGESCVQKRSLFSARSLEEYDKEFLRLPYSTI